MTSGPSRQERYASAFAALPANVAPLLAGNAIDGYWIDAEHFFGHSGHAAPGAEPELPLLVDRRSGAARCLISTETFETLTGQRLTSGARFAMPAPDRLSVADAGRAWLIDLAEQRIVHSLALPEQPASHSPDGLRAVVVKGTDLALIDLQDGTEHWLTQGGLPDFPYGQMPQTGLATVSYQRQPSPFAIWSDDGQWLATHRIDERHLPERVLTENAPEDGSGPRFHRHRYADARAPELPMVTMVAIHPTSGRTIQSAAEPMHMFAPLTCGQAWFAGEWLCWMRTDRYHRRLALIGLNLTTGAETILAEETCTDGYLECHPIVGTPPNMRLLPESGEVLWWSERDGWGHLYLLEAGTSKLLRQVTTGAWQVRDVVHLDVQARTVLIAATGRDPADPLLRCLLRVSLDGGEPELLAAPEGHDLGLRGGWSGGAMASQPWAPVRPLVSAAPDGGAVVLRRSSPAEGSRTLLRDLATGQEVPIAACLPDPAHQVVPIWLDLLAADGETALKAALYLPEGASGPLPLVDLIYPGPQSSVLSRAYWNRMSDQARTLNRLGLAALVTDTRGLPFRSRALHQCGYGDLVEPQLADHVAVIGQICARYPQIDPARIGIMGSSAGGYASARAMFRYPEIFRAGVAICGTDDPAHYLSGWLEKYVGPDEDGRWAAQITGQEAARLAGDLMIVHGDMDENVHPFHAVSLVRRLTEAGKSCELVIVPNAGHLVQATSAYAQQRIWDFLLRHLAGEAPSGDCGLRYAAENVAAAGRAAAREGLWC